jgi:hypothetical protein
MKKRLITSFFVSLISASFPMVYAWLKVGYFEFGNFIASQFFLSSLIFALVFIAAFMHPDWEND